MVKHIIITRFNLSERWSKDKNGRNVLDEEWLKNRYDLFESFCFPSIQSQSNQNFEWWVYFDLHTEDQYKDRNEKLHNVYSNFIPKYERSYENFENNMPKDIDDLLLRENKKWLITTRLDNDDILAKNTIDIIQKVIGFNQESILEIPFGYTLELKNKSVLKRVESYLNPFISLLEKKEKHKNVKTVYFHQHNQWVNTDRKSISSEPQWIQIIHDKNVSNRSMGEEVYPFDLYNKFEFSNKNIRFSNYLVFIMRKIYSESIKLKHRNINRLHTLQNKTMLIKRIKKIINENRSFQKEQIALLKELDWANTYHDSIRGKVWLENLPLNIGRWAGNYSFFYVLNRVLYDYKPNRILEMGLGETTKFISSYLENYLLESSHVVIEHDVDWKKTYLQSQSQSISKRTIIEICPLEQKTIKNHTTNSYKRITNTVTAKFDLYVIDGPFGSPRFSRYDIVNLANKFSVTDEFIILLDDYNRLGEQDTAKELISILKDKKITIYTAIYAGNKSVLVIATEKYKYATSL